MIQETYTYGKSSEGGVSYEQTWHAYDKRDVHVYQKRPKHMT